MIKKLSEKLRQMDRSSWQKFQFQEIAESISERIDPTDTDLEVYVGLEHIDSEDIHIRRKGKRDDVKGQKLRCYPGDVIFGRRRAYQRKAAVVDFDGFCSAHALVLRARAEVIHPKLFPFFLHSDAFMNRAVDISVGSLSPTINWGTLKHQEFLLPPIEVQEKMVKLLLSMDDSLQSIVEFRTSLTNLLNVHIWESVISGIPGKKLVSKKTKSLFQTRFEMRKVPENWITVKLGTVLEDVQNGFAEGKREERGIPQLRMNNVSKDGRLNLEKITYIPKKNNCDRYKIDSRDILFCNTNSEDLVGKTIIASKEISGFVFSNHFTRIRAKQSKLSQEYLYIWLKFYFDIGFFERVCTRWIGQASVQVDTLKKMYIELPPLNEQAMIAARHKSIESCVYAAEKQVDTSSKLLFSLINQIF